MFESMAAWVMVEHLYGETFVPPRETIGYKRILNPYRRPFKTRDGYMAILPYTDQNWRGFFSPPAPPDSLHPPPPNTPPPPPQNAPRSGHKHDDSLPGARARIAAPRTTPEWPPDLDRRNIPPMTVNSLESLLHDPHLEAVGFWQIVEHPTEGTMRLPGIPAVY